jgi:hypothetical protein
MEVDVDMEIDDDYDPSTNTWRGLLVKTTPSSSNLLHHAINLRKRKGPIPMEVDDDDDMEVDDNYDPGTNTWRGWSQTTSGGRRKLGTSPSVLPPWHGQSASAFPMVFGTSPSIGRR